MNSLIVSSKQLGSLALGGGLKKAIWEDSAAIGRLLRSAATNFNRYV